MSVKNTYELFICVVALLAGLSLICAVYFLSGLVVEEAKGGDPAPTEVVGYPKNTVTITIEPRRCMAIDGNEVEVPGHITCDRWFPAHREEWQMNKIVELEQRIKELEEQHTRASAHNDGGHHD